jgi:hypothetical protein
VDFNSISDKSSPEQLWYYFSEFLHKCESKFIKQNVLNKSGDIQHTLSDVLSFSHNALSIKFWVSTHNCFQSQNACSLKLALHLQNNEFLLIFVMLFCYQWKGWAMMVLDSFRNMNCLNNSVFTSLAKNFKYSYILYTFRVMITVSKQFTKHNLIISHFGHLHVSWLSSLMCYN